MTRRVTIPTAPFDIPADRIITRAAPSTTRKAQNEDHMVWVDTYSMDKPAAWQDELQA